MATSGLANFSKSTTNDGGSSSKVTMDQIRQLEAKIECLNSQIANLTKKPLAEQKQLMDEHVKALQESNMVHSDETLGWRLSAVDMQNENSRLITPYGQREFDEFPDSQ